MITYEWDYETLNEHGDIIDHNHADKLLQFSHEDVTDTLVLVRDKGTENNGLQERTWAYVIDNFLPDYFSDATGNPLHKVPKIFKEELIKYNETKKW